jgi:hypothetical protein
MIVDANAGTAREKRDADAFGRERQTPGALGAMEKADAAKWWPIIKESGLKAQ